MRKLLKSQVGFSIVESLVSISLIGIVVVGTTSLFVTSFALNTASKSHSSALGDVQAIFDNYRNQSYSNLLSLFGDSYATIANDDTATDYVYSSNSNTSYGVVLTAIKTKVDTIPEAIKVTTTVNLNKGKLGNEQVVYETVIAQINK